MKNSMLKNNRNIDTQLGKKLILNTGNFIENTRASVLRRSIKTYFKRTRLL